MHWIFVGFFIFLVWLEQGVFGNLGRVLDCGFFFRFQSVCVYDLDGLGFRIEGILFLTQRKTFDVFDGETRVENRFMWDRCEITIL